MKIPFIVKIEDDAFRPLVSPHEKEQYLAKILAYNNLEEFVPKNTMDYEENMNNQRQANKFWKVVQAQFLLNACVMPGYVFAQLEKFKKKGPIGFYDNFDNIEVRYELSSYGMSCNLKCKIKSRFSDAEALDIKELHQEYVRFARIFNDDKSIDVQQFKMSEKAQSLLKYVSGGNYSQYGEIDSKECEKLIEVLKPRLQKINPKFVYTLKNASEVSAAFLDSFKEVFPALAIQLERLQLKNTVIPNHDTITPTEKKGKFKL